MTGTEQRAGAWRAPRATAGAAGSIVLSAIPPFLTGSLLPFMRDDLDLTTTRLGIVVALYFTGSAICAVPAGRLADRLTSRQAILLGNTGTAASLLAMGLFARTWVHLALLLVVAGCSNGMTQPASNLAVVRGVRVRRRGMAFGIKQAAAPVATMFAGLAIPALALTVGWRWAYVAAAFPLPVIALLLPRDRTTPGRSPTPRHREATRILIRVSVAAGFGFAAATTLGAFLVDAIVSSGGSAEFGAAALMTASVVCIVVRLIVGWYSDRMASPSVLLVAWLMGVGAVGFAVLVVADTPVVWIVGAAIGLAAGWGWPGLLYHVIATAHPDAPAAATGFTTVGNAIGAVVGPVLFGIIASTVSFGAAWALCAGMGTVAAWLLVSVHRQGLAAQAAEAGG